MSPPSAWLLASSCPVGIAQPAVPHAGSEAAVLTAQEWASVEADNWVVHTDPAAVYAALDGRGRKESALLQKLQPSFGLPKKKDAPPRKIRV